MFHRHKWLVTSIQPSLYDRMLDSPRGGKMKADSYEAFVEANSTVVRYECQCGAQKVERV